jgi:hypothetical protein
MQTKKNITPIHALKGVNKGFLHVLHERTIPTIPIPPFRALKEYLRHKETTEGENHHPSAVCL